MRQGRLEGRPLIAASRDAAYNLLEVWEQLVECEAQFFVVSRTGAPAVMAESQWERSHHIPCRT
jgi:hypothetical protein